MDLPNEILQRILLNPSLSEKDLKEISLTNSHFHQIVSDWNFWWKKSVMEGLTEISGAEFQRLLEITVDSTESLESTEFIETTVECSFFRDKITPFELYVRFRDTNPEDDPRIDEVYEEAAKVYMRRHLSLVAAHCSYDCLENAINDFTRFDAEDGDYTDVADIYVIAAYRGFLGDLISFVKRKHIFRETEDIRPIRKALETELKNQPYNYKLLSDLLFIYTFVRNGDGRFDDYHYKKNYYTHEFIDTVIDCKKWECINDIIDEEQEEEKEKGEKND